MINLAMHNGLLMPIAAITLLSGFLLPLLAAMVGSYQLAGEAETGTMKTWLMHSISRGGVVVSKWGVAIIFVAIGLILVAVGAFAAGALAFGLHAPTLLTGQTVSMAHGLELTALSYLYVMAGVICVLSLALLFATFTNSSLTAAIGALVVVIVMNILGAFSYFDFLKPYLFTSRIDAWQGLFSQPVESSPILKGVLVFVIYTAVLLIAAWLKFRRKDILV
jgi:ABC-2 type transport system permease protein